MLTRDALEHAKGMYIAFDKADSQQGKVGGCVKIVAAFDDRRVSDYFPDGEVMTVTLDADKSGDTSKEVAQYVNHSIKKMILEVAKLLGITTDSGGGGTIESVAKRLEEMGLLDAIFKLVGNCTLHDINLENFR